MVTGIDSFKEWFKGSEEQYTIIGGTACDILMTEEGLETYLDTFKHGMPPHGGLGIGMERLTMQLLGEDNVRETTLFPRDLSRLTP